MVETEFGIGVLDEHALDEVAADALLLVLGEGLQLRADLLGKLATGDLGGHERFPTCTDPVVTVLLVVHRRAAEVAAVAAGPTPFVAMPTVVAALLAEPSTILLVSPSLAAAGILAVAASVIPRRILAVAASAVAARLVAVTAPVISTGVAAMTAAPAVTSRASVGRMTLVPTGAGAVSVRSGLAGGIAAAVVPLFPPRCGL
ncbi:hypothetical protein M3A96_03745 [Helcobacillus massiliensis]|uniref:Uncharacterized protein n=1 Tax=Helcobacillus massiliensis TaxID=521392 RepID=A0A839QUZ2_9MICO|nr:hypothetical protein [Helcobacillus massiliensis]MBB3022600.1 hypothetical protein [Helcobacillus massiliensis]MCT1557234.1 hypothetical protein [Helcobacillus massiliensis]MCT2036916.1 hypothetical protein [Helcobacillus massiliensis]MCT2332694.1 hypothetical protein [Helcobacillus massiliensis]